MKTFLSTFTGLVVIVILAIVVIGFIFWSRVPDIVANNLAKKMQVAVKIDSFGLGWGKVDVNKIAIGNPPGSLLAKAFTCDQIAVLAPFSNYFKQAIVIDEIDLMDVYLGLEFDSPTSTNGNWTVIMGNLKKSMGTESPPPQKSEKRKKTERKAQPQQPNGAQKSLLIHRIVLTNIDVDVVYKKDGGKVKRLPRIPRMELTEISSQGGLPMDQLLNSVLGEMLKQVFIKENLKNMMQEFLNAPSPIQQYLSPLKGLFRAVPKENNCSIQAA